ncbi:MAG TPA: ABC transporter substrate-binding protein [Acidimicrobiales bacterium]|nr:ABC transporter substrate-binding protein [Acidimicrobiales bacterium]
MGVDDNTRGVDHRRLSELRRGRGPIEEHIIDEFVAKRLSRRDFLRRGTAIGLSLPFLGAILDAVGSASAAASPKSSLRSPMAKSGATIRAGILVPAGAINPLTIEDEGGLELLGNVGEYLVLANQQGQYKPWLATSWSSNANASVWTFKIRQGVKFNDGTPMTIDDVVYSFQSQANPKNGSNALSVFGGLLSPEGVVKVDSETVAFHLESPDAVFPDAVSSDNYNMIVVPNGYDYSNYQKDFVGTGHFKMSSYTAEVGATYVPNPYYWGTAALPSQVQWTFYPSETPMAAALEAGSIDCLDQFTVATSPQLLNGSYNIINLKSSLHRELSMRTDLAPFTSNYVRQALAYTLDRPAIVTSLFKGYAQVGNDNPFAPVFPQTVGPPAVPQRAQNLKLAKELLAKGGVPNGFKTVLVTEQRQEMAEMAQIMKAAAAQIGVTIDLTVETPTKYYGSGVYGTSDWLDGDMSMVDYGARSVPNLFLEAPLQTFNKTTGSGAWNAARFNNPTYDALSKEYIAAIDLSSQRALAQKIELLLLNETPIIYAYFYNFLSASQKNVTGIYPTQLSQFFLWNATKS